MKAPSRFTWFYLAVVLWPAGLSFSVAQNEPVRIGNQRELFVDSYLIEKADHVRLTLHHPRAEGEVLRFDSPWEGAFCGYGTVIKDGPLFRMYYRGVPVAGKDGNPNEVTCYAESGDGKNWVKPNLGLYELNGSKQNNVVLAAAAPATHNFSPFLDTNPKAPANARYKAVGGTDASGLLAYRSADGIHWEKIGDGPVIRDGMFDSQNVVFWSESEQQYVCYFRTWSDGGYKGFRSVSRATSKDFVSWSTTAPMTFGNTPLEHLYTQQTSAYYRAPQIYVAIGARFMPDRQVVSESQAAALNVNPKYYKDCSDAIFMTSRGSNVYDRTFMESFIRPGVGLRNWVSRSNYPLLNVVETGPEEMSVYVNEDYAQPTAHIKRYSMRIDGFASLEAGYNGGTVLTKPFVFSGTELEINYSTSAAGAIRIAVLGADGKPVSGFGLQDCQPVIGNEIRRIVNWGGKRDVSALAGKTVRLKIEMKDANLYSMKFN
ncbi:hypothetical protein GCM10023091_04410 [Ravibacter arvi]|uniref:Uncharacterized protein n=1 Tax=Ravibacter arvi TaxID=2051041 RepID=A0ABP8LQ26_9BACT